MDLIVMQDVWSAFWPAIWVKCSMLDRRFTSYGQNGAIIKLTLESMVRKLHVCKNISLIIFVALAILAS